jgi:hypothetical protein
VKLPERHNPMKRRKQDELGRLVAQLMDLLKLDASTNVH